MAIELDIPMSEAHKKFASDMRKEWEAMEKEIVELEIPESQGEITAVTEALEDFIHEKNVRYGNAALSPVGVFNKDALAGIRARLDDKLGRIKHSEELRKNDVVDLMGYLVLLCVKMGWTSFSDLID